MCVCVCAKLYHLYEPKSPYDLVCIHVCSDWKKENNELILDGSLLAY